MNVTLSACLLAALAVATLDGAKGDPATLSLSPFRTGRGQKHGAFSLRSFGAEMIVGGHVTTIIQHPYMVSIEEYYTWAPKWFHKCGGSILNEYNILSAAHCIQDEPKAKYRVRAGSTTRGRGGTVIEVAKVFYHPKFDATAIDYDVGIFRLAKPLNVGGFGISRVTLPKIGAPVPDKATFQIIGWGAEEAMAFTYPRRLQQTSVSRVPQATCEKDYKGTRAVTKRMICADGPGKDSCTGDSGGPMLLGSVQWGLVSWGDVCAQADHPGVYTNLADADIRAYITKTLNSK